jgi:hypothetical protein
MTTAKYALYIKAAQEINDAIEPLLRNPDSALSIIAEGTIDSEPYYCFDRRTGRFVLLVNGKCLGKP